MSYIKNHNKPYFLNSTFPPNFKTGSKNVSAILTPHAGSAFVKEILDFAFDKIDISPFNKVILLTTNHSTRDNFQILERGHEENTELYPIIPISHL